METLARPSTKALYGPIHTPSLRERCTDYGRAHRPRSTENHDKSSSHWGQSHVHLSESGSLCPWGKLPTGSGDNTPRSWSTGAGVMPDPAGAKPHYRAGTKATGARRSVQRRPVRRDPKRCVLSRDPLRATVYTFSQVTSFPEHLVRSSLALQRRRDTIRRVVSKHHTQNARIFSSVAQGTDAEGSDLDILIQPAPASRSEQSVSRAPPATRHSGARPSRHPRTRYCTPPREAP